MLKLVSEMLCTRGGQKLRPYLGAQASGFHTSKVKWFDLMLLVHAAFQFSYVCAYITLAGVTECSRFCLVDLNGSPIGHG